MAEQRGSDLDASAQDAVAAAIAGWTSCSVSREAAAFAREVVARAEPHTSQRAKALLFSASRLAGFGEQLGLELSVQALLQETTIERFVLCGCDGLQPASVRTLRTNLRALGRSLGPHPEPEPVPLPRERAKRPYSDAEIEGYLRLAACQPTEARRMRASALVCLGAGAGIVACELRHLRGAHVVCRAGGVLVEVSGRRARTVPVLQRFSAPLLTAASFAGDALICGGREPGRRNVSDELCRALSADSSLPRLEPGRLRCTWLAWCARRIGLGAFMRAAGIRCSQRLGDLIAELNEIDEEAVVALLGGAGDGPGRA